VVEILSGTEAFFRLIGAILSPFVTLKRVVSWARSIYLNRLNVRRITERDDDFVAMCELHDRLFPHDVVGDNPTDIERWLEESRANVSNTALDDILLVSKFQNEVVGYIYAQYYKDSRYIFVSYLGIDDQVLEARQKAATLLLRELLKYARTSGYAWKGIVGEIEEYRRMNYGRENGYELRARKLMYAFQRDIRKIATKFRMHAEVYRLYFKYLQPALRVEDIEDRNALDERELKQWILYVPHDQNAREIAKSEDGTLYISRHLTLEILQFILLQTYADAHQGNSRYFVHLEQELDKYAKLLPENVEVTREWRRH
jgi:hypothetical protein